MLDAALHGLAALVDDGHRYLATGIGSIRVHRKPRSARLRSVLRIERGDPDVAFRADVLLLDGTEPVAELAGIRFTAIAARSAPRPADRPAGPALPPADDLLALAAPQRLGVVRDGIRATVARLLSIGDAASVDPHAAFLELGMDSLAAAELRTALETAVPVTLAPTAIFDHGCAEDLAAHLVSRL